VIASLPALALVVGLLAVAVFILRRYERTHGKGRLCVVETIQIGPSRTAVVLRAGSRCFLIATSGSEVSKVAELDASEWAETEVVETVPEVAEQPTSRRLFRRLLEGLPLLLVLMTLFAGIASAQVQPPTAPLLPDIRIIDQPEQMGLPMQILLLLTVMTLIPAALASVTPFLRIVIVLHFLRQAIGTQTAPGNQTLLGLAMFLTIVLMQPVANQVYEEAVVPVQQGEMGHYEGLEAAKGPIKRYLSRFVREKDVALFLDITGQPRPNAPEDLDLVVLAPAYMLSELKISFQIGAVLFLPFLIIDLLVASVTLSLGMIQLPPVMISTPFKLLLFVLIDGWNLVVGSLVRGFY
jgi:flagellar biosynthetic protein FliP